MPHFITGESVMEAETIWDWEECRDRYLAEQSYIRYRAEQDLIRQTNWKARNDREIEGSRGRGRRTNRGRGHQ